MPLNLPPLAFTGGSAGGGAIGDTLQGGPVISGPAVGRGASSSATGAPIGALAGPPSWLIWISVAAAALALIVALFSLKR